MGNLLTVSNLSVKYKHNVILENIFLDIDKVGITALLGPNNCGKTTLIRTITGILPSKNIVTVADVTLNKSTAKEYLINIGVVLTEIDRQLLFEDVESELYFPLENLNISKDDIKLTVERTLKYLKLEKLIEKKTNELTQLEKVQVLLILTILHRPKIIFLDDILSGLDDLSKDKVFKMFKTIVDKFDIAIFYTTSNLLEAYKANRVIVLNKGHIVMDDSPKKLLSKDNELIKMGIEIPLMIDLSLKLKFYNLLDDVILDVDRMVNKLWP